RQRWRAAAGTVPPPSSTRTYGTRYGVLRHNVVSRRVGQRPQPQAPPQQPPDAPVDGEAARPASATVDSSLTVSSCPRGHTAGSLAALIGRSTSKVSPQARQRNSYRGMSPG